MWISGLKGLTTTVEAVVEKFDRKGLCVHHPQSKPFRYQSRIHLLILNMTRNLSLTNWLSVGHLEHVTKIK